jgi:hypothetical protein
LPREISWTRTVSVIVKPLAGVGCCRLGTCVLLCRGQHVGNTAENVPFRLRLLSD